MVDTVDKGGSHGLIKCHSCNVVVSRSQHRVHSTSKTHNMYFKNKQNKQNKCNLCLLYYTGSFNVHVS